VTADRDSLRVEAHVPDQPLTRPGPGIVEVRITNTGERPFLVNRRFAPGYRESSSRELFADVFRPHSDEASAAHALLYDRHPPVREDYVALDPGSSLADSFDLLDWYRIRQPGPYELVVYYQADEPLAPDLPGLLRGIHASERVPFVVASCRKLARARVDRPDRREAVVGTGAHAARLWPFEVVAATGWAATCPSRA
jgi:hypothetical protein